MRAHGHLYERAFQPDHKGARANALARAETRRLYLADEGGGSALAAS